MLSIDPVSYAERAGISMHEDQKEMTRAMYEAVQQKGIVFVAQGPTGMGKTYCISAVAAAMADRGKRVCIAAPTYAHVETVIIPQLTRVLDASGMIFGRLRGVSHLGKDEGCPFKNGRLPSALFCGGGTYGPETENCRDQNCAMRRDFVRAQAAKIVVTVFAKLIATPRLIEGFDVIIFDESHGLESNLNSGRTSQIKIESLDTLIVAFPEYGEQLGGIKSQLHSLAKLPSNITELPPQFVQSRIRDPLKEPLERIRARIEEQEVTQGSEISPEIVNAYFDLSRAVTAFTNVESYRYARTGSNNIIAIPNQVTFAPPTARKIGSEQSIVLVSATVEHAKLHARDAGFPFHVLAAPIQIDIDKAVRLKNRFARRPIFGLIDGPIMKKDPNDLGSYDTARKKANKIIYGIVSSVVRPTLILCRSKTDQKSIEQTLNQGPSVSTRLYSLTEQDESLELDLLAHKINEEIKKGHDVVLASASSRLWEGANIDDLRLLIVDSLPYPTPEPIERRSTGSWKTSRTFRFMLRRLQQGIGRLIRKDGDYGVAIVVDGRFYANWKTIGSELPLYMKSPLKFVGQQELQRQVLDTFTKLEIPS